MAQCRAQGTTASAAIRGFVERQLGELAPRRAAARFVRPVLAAGMVAAIAGAMVVAPAASTPNFGPRFAAYDKNRDGLISHAEYGGTRPRKSGCSGPLALPLKRAGLDKGQRPFAERKDDSAFATIDRDGDGQVSRDEYAVHRLTLRHQGYAALDIDRDGSLDAREYAGAKKIVFLGPQPDLATFAELDGDRDGRIVWREYLA